jgi:pimeloyl-ACP methyl ester carboxylesterase
MSPRFDVTFVDRGYKKAAMVLMGWGTDRRLLSEFSPFVNLLIVEGLSGRTDLEELEELLAEKGATVNSIMGFSLGGLLAIDLVLVSHHNFEKVTVVGISPHYGEETLLKVGERLADMKERYFDTFFRECFGRESEYRLFLSHYVEGVPFNFERLLAGLSYLGQINVDSDTLVAVSKKCKTLSVIHGALDRISPMGEMESLCNGLACLDWVVLKKVGHIPFFNEKARRVIEDIIR